MGTKSLTHRLIHLSISDLQFLPAILVCGLSVQLCTDMKSHLVLTILIVILDVCVSQIAPPVDTVFAKGGTCLYKIYKEYNACMNVQQERLNRDTGKMSRYVTVSEQQTSLNRIGCCAYWEFLSCVERAADEKCHKDKTDMREYTRQLGSAVPLHICEEEVPRDSDVCDSANSLTNRFNYCLFFSLLLILKFFELIF